MIQKKRLTKIQSLKPLSFVIFSTILISSLSFPVYAETPQATLNYNPDATSSIYPVRLNFKLLDSKTKVIGSTVIEENSKNIYTVVETTYTARAQAFGGDVYLPAYREDVVFSPNVAEPSEGTNALIAGVPSIELIGSLPQVKGKYLLKEYEHIDMKIKISFKVLPTAMPSRIVFAPELNTLLSYPAVYQNGLNDPGIDAETGARIINIPLVNATYVPQQVTRVDWKGDSVILLKGGKVYSAIKEGNKLNALANIKSIFRRIFSE